MNSQNCEAKEHALSDSGQLWEWHVVLNHRDPPLEGPRSKVLECYPLLVACFSGSGLLSANSVTVSNDLRP